MSATFLTSLNDALSSSFSRIYIPVTFCADMKLASCPFSLSSRVLLFHSFCFFFFVKNEIQLCRVFWGFFLFFLKTHARARDSASRSDYLDTRRGTNRTNTPCCTEPPHCRALGRLRRRSATLGRRLLVPARPTSGA